jgi:hypothetical protein
MRSISRHDLAIPAPWGPETLPEANLNLTCSIAKAPAVFGCADCYVPNRAFTTTTTHKRKVTEASKTEEKGSPMRLRSPPALTVKVNQRRTASHHQTDSGPALITTQRSSCNTSPAYTSHTRTDAQMAMGAQRRTASESPLCAVIYWRSATMHYSGRVSALERRRCADRQSILAPQPHLELTLGWRCRTSRPPAWAALRVSKLSQRARPKQNSQAPPDSCRPQPVACG